MLDPLTIGTTIASIASGLQLLEQRGKEQHDDKLISIALRADNALLDIQRYIKQQDNRIADYDRVVAEREDWKAKYSALERTHNDTLAELDKLRPSEDGLTDLGVRILTELKDASNSLDDLKRALNEHPRKIDLELEDLEARKMIVIYGSMIGGMPTQFGLDSNGTKALLRRGIIK